MVTQLASEVQEGVDHHLDPILAAHPREVTDHGSGRRNGGRIALELDAVEDDIQRLEIEIAIGLEPLARLVKAESLEEF